MARGRLTNWCFHEGIFHGGSDVFMAVKALQTQIDSHTVAGHQTLQQYMASVDSRLEDLRKQINGPSTTYAGGLSSHQTLEIPPELGDAALLLRTMKLEVPKFDGLTRIDRHLELMNFFIFMVILIFYDCALWLFILRAEHLLGING